MLKAYFNLTKSGIVIFTLLTGMAGFAGSYTPSESYDWVKLALFLIGLYLISSGSFALNQAQEWRLDSKMERTKERPIPAGVFSTTQAYLIALLFIVMGSFLLALINPTTALLGLITIILYNGFYTLYWKKKWAFGAVPGAIPGAMPVVIGYSVNTPFLLTPDCGYLFLIMFLWQMPHFWCLAIRYKDDYGGVSIPVLPAVIGVPKTLYHMGLYTFVYVALALSSPWFVTAHAMYFVLVIPFALKVIWEFLKYYQSDDQKRWLPFFLWTNFSMLAFIIAPVVDKWLYRL
ncbi:MAG: protoheme IX farnesyltransferase [Bdellovibrionaceae bacterium]|nr:protoheme IX farnesyltransferase [Pseudobdellovibrionaceae bacterium]|tara:strand:+ start:71960 stop:72826 length:867 start_codon:yes stop_codon:yes gene_type:complete